MSASTHWIWIGASLLSVSGCITDGPGPDLERPQVLAACKQSRIDIRQRIEVDELFIDSAYLNYLAGTQTDRGHVQHPSMEHLVRYTLEKGLTALETQARNPL
jgi:hypothetical protein